MSVFCANKNNPSYQELVAAVGSEQAEQLWDINNGYPLTHTNTGEPSEFYQFIKGLYPDKNRVELLRVIGPIIKKYGPVSNSKVNASKYSFGFDNIETEMQEIRTKAIANGDIKLKEDGTFDYALAPNRQRSNLNEEQWLQVRTKAFKEWFGDWERLAEFISLEDKFKLEEISKSEDSDPDDLSTRYKVFYDGKEIGFVALNQGDKTKFVSIAGIGLNKEFRHKGIGKQLYKYLAYQSYKQGKEFFSDNDEIHSFTQDARNVWQSFVNKGLAHYDRNHYVFDLPANASKVVDENGEPLVVYHYTDNENLNEFSVDFDNYFAQSGGTKKAIFFTEDKVEKGEEDNFLTQRKARKSVFLNIKDLKTYNGTKEDLHKKGTSYREVVNKSAKENDVDGGVHMSGFDDNKKTNQDIWIIHNPNQIKSATDNVGTFSESEDINLFIDPNDLLKQGKIDEYVEICRKSNIKDIYIANILMNNKNFGQQFKAFYETDEIDDVDRIEGRRANALEEFYFLMKDEKGINFESFVKGLIARKDNSTFLKKDPYNTILKKNFPIFKSVKSGEITFAHAAEMVQSAYRDWNDEESDNLGADLISEFVNEYKTLRSIRQALDGKKIKLKNATEKLDYAVRELSKSIEEDMFYENKRKNITSQLINHLRKSGINVLGRADIAKYFREHPNSTVLSYYNFKLESQSQNTTKEDEEQFFLTPNGEIYGFVDNKGNIYLDETIIDGQQPIHEYTHLWDLVVKKKNPKFWKRGVELMKQSELWESIENDPNYGGRWKSINGMTPKRLEDLIASEVHARLTGKSGNDIISNVYENESVIEKLKRWLLEFWEKLKSAFSDWTEVDLQNLTLDDFVNMTLKDFVNGTKLSLQDETINDTNNNLVQSVINNGQKAAEVKCTLPGQQRSTYVVIGEHIYKDGKEVYSEPSPNRNRIYANLAVQEGRAVVVEYGTEEFVVNKKGQIISVATGEIVYENKNGANRNSILDKANYEFFMQQEIQQLDQNLQTNQKQQQVQQTLTITPAQNVMSNAIKTHSGAWTRQEAKNNPKVLYVFTDNTDRDSGTGIIPVDSWYSKKYGIGHHYPSITAAVIRGLDNARPISTQRWYHKGATGAKGNWTDADVEEFKSVIRDELQEIVNEFNTGKYDTIMFPGGDGLFNTKISNITKTRTPKLYQALSDLLHEFGFDVLIPEYKQQSNKTFSEQQSQSQQQQTQNSDLLSKDKATEIMRLAANQTKKVIVEENKFKSEQVINEMINAYKNLPAETKEVIAEIEKKNNGNPLYMALSSNKENPIISELFYDAYFRTRDINHAIKVKSLIFTEKYKAFLNNSRLVVHGTKDYSDEHNIVYRQKNNEPRLFYLVEDNIYSSFPTLNKETQTYIPVFISTKAGKLISGAQKKQEDLYEEAKKSITPSVEGNQYAIVWVDSIEKTTDPISGNTISERKYFVNKNNIDSYVMDVDYVVNNYEHSEYISADKNNPTQQAQQQQTQPQAINDFNTYKDVSENGEIVDVRYNLDYNPIATLESEKIDRPSVAELANTTVEKVLGDKEAMKAKMTYDFANLVTSGQITENDRNELANTLLDKISETIDDIIAGNISNLSEFVDKDALRKAEASVREHWLDNEESLRKQIINALGINTLIKEAFYRVIKNNYNVLDFNGNIVKDTSSLTKEELKIVNDVAILLKNKYCFLEHIKNQLYQYEGIKLVIDKNKVLDISNEIDKASQEEQKTVTENSEIDNSETEPSAISIDAKSEEINSSSDDDLNGFSFLENQLTKDFYASLSSTIKRKIHRIGIKEISKFGRSKIKRNKYGGRKYYNENVIYETLKKEFKDCLCGAKDKSNNGEPRDYLKGRSIEEKFEQLNDSTIPWIRDVKRIFMNEAGYNQLFSAIGNMSENKYLNGNIKKVRVANMSLNKNTMRERIMQQASLNSAGKIIQSYPDITVTGGIKYYIHSKNYEATSKIRQNIYNILQAFGKNSTPTVQDVIDKYEKVYNSDIYTDLYKILDSIFISTISRKDLKELMNSFKDGQALISFLNNITYNVKAILQGFYDRAEYKNGTTTITSEEYDSLSEDERKNYSKVDIYKDPFFGAEWGGKILSNMTVINVAIGLEYSSLDSMLASQNINGKQYYSISPSNAIQRTINDIRAKDKDQYEKQVIDEKVRKDFFFGGTTPNTNNQQLYDEAWFNHIYKDLKENKSYFMFNTFASFMGKEYSKLSPQEKKFYNLKMYFYYKKKSNKKYVITQYASVVTADKATTGTFTMRVFESDKNKGAYSGRGYSEVAQRMYSTFVQEMMRMKAVYNLAVAKDAEGKPVLQEENFTASLIKDDETREAKMVSKVIDSETPNEKTIEHYVVDNHMKTGFRFAFMPYFNEAIQDKKTYSNKNLEYINYLIYKYIYGNDSEAIFGNQDIMDNVCNIIEAELEKKAKNYMEEIKDTVSLAQLLQVLDINFNNYKITAINEDGNPRDVDITELNWRSLFDANLINGASRNIDLIVDGKDKRVSTFEDVENLQKDILSKIQDYTYNATYANSQILMLMTGDIARYKDYTDMQKRAAEFVSPGLTYNLTAKYNGALVSQDGLKNIIVFEDNEGAFTDMNQVSKILKYRRDAKLLRAENAWKNKIISTQEYKVLEKQINDEYDSSTGHDGYTGTNATDGQSWISVDWLRKHLIMLDRFDRTARKALFLIDEMIDAIKFDKDGELTEKSKEVLKDKWENYMLNKDCARFHIESIKPFAYTQMPIQNKTIDGIQTSTPVQFKNAEQAILDIEYAIKTLDVTALRIAKFLRDTGLDAIATKSNIKVGKRGIIKLDRNNIKTLLADENVEGSLMNQKIISRRLATENPGNIDWSEGKINKDFIYSIPLQNAVLQQETPEDYFGEKTILGSQAQVLITDACYDDTTWEIKHYNEDGEKGISEQVNGSEVRGRIDKLLAKKCEIGVEKLFDTIVDKNGNKCGRAILNKLKQGEMLTTNEQVMMNKMLANLLREHFEMDGKSTYDTILQTTIMPDGYPYVPFNDPINWNKLQSVLVSIIKKHTVKSKVNGGHLVQVTDAFRFDKGIEESVKDGDVALDSRLKIIYNKAVDAEGNVIKDANGKIIRDARFGIEYMEAAIPVYNPIIWKELVNANMTENGEVKKKYIDENGFIKMEKVPEAFKRIVAYRIPTEGYNSMFAVQCKFTTSRVNGGQIRLPWEITTIAGTDYDIDKLFFLSPAIGKFDNGSAKYITTNKPINEMSEAEVNNALFETMWSILTSPNIIEKQLNPGGFLRLKNERNMFSAFEQLIKNEIDKNGSISAEKKIELFNDVYTEKKQTDIKSIVNGRYENTDLCDPSVQDYIHMRNYVGAQMIGIFANQTQTHSRLKFKDIKIHGKELIRKILSQKKEFSIEFNFLNKSLSDTLVDFDPIYSRDMTTETIENLVQFLTAAVDAIKDPLLSSLNINLSTINIGIVMLRLGYTINDVILFLNQPIIKLLSSKGNINKNIGNYIKKNISKVSNLNITQNDLISNIVDSSYDKEKQLIYDKKIALIAQYFLKISDELRNVINCCKISGATTHTYKDYFELTDFIDNIDTYLEKNKEGETIFDESISKLFDKDSDAKSDTLITFRDDLKLLKKSLIEDINPYLGYHFKSILKRLKSINNRISAREVYNAYMKYMWWKHLGDSIWNTPANMDSRIGNDADENMFYAFDRLINESLRPMLKGIYDYIVDNPGAYEDNEIIKKLVLDRTNDNIDIIKLNVFDMALDRHQKMSSDLSELLSDKTMITVGDHIYPMSVIIEEILLNNIVQNGFDFSSKSVLRFLSATAKASNGRYINFLEKENTEHVNEEAFIELFLRNNPQYIPDLTEKFTDPVLQVRDSETDKIVQLYVTEDMLKSSMPKIISMNGNIYKFSGDPYIGYYIVPKLGGNNGFEEYFDCLITKQTSSILQNNLDYLSIFNSDMNVSYSESRDNENSYKKFKDNFENALNLFDEEMFKDPFSTNEQGEYVLVKSDLKEHIKFDEKMFNIISKRIEEKSYC